MQALFDPEVSRNLYCVNIDAVIAALLLNMDTRRPASQCRYVA